MAKPSPATILTTAALISLLICLVALSATPANGLGGMVGGRSKVEDVKTNREIQELGRYSVKEYNRKRNGGYGLKFAEVVEAEKQVVSGIKYYLKISAATPTGAPKIFEAVVVVKPWLHSKQLLHFSPSPATK
ncbi:hypothetical protein RJ639_034650 [Escallonia herrerae]|uniref:Cystatin domain-containing protein n=1 Tax=Escallonia herrerae TaxID=1293975 RepID=A0AA89B8R7_9ASTE|nr:hypothetical protein RJ639_034650 [Escallonia herrerae]